MSGRPEEEPHRGLRGRLRALARKVVGAGATDAEAPPAAPPLVPTALPPLMPPGRFSATPPPSGRPIPPLVTAGAPSAPPPAPAPAKPGATAMVRPEAGVHSSDEVDPRSAAAHKGRTSSRDGWAGGDGDGDLPTIAHAGLLPALSGMPDYLLPEERRGEDVAGRLSCGYCGVGDSGAAGSAGRVGDRSPTPGCGKLDIATGEQGTLFPLHTAPSILDRYATRRRSISYDAAVARFADLLLDHREPDTQVLVYGCGQIDYFTIFALQEVFRLLGVRNLAGNAEHCLNAGAVHNEMLTGQEGPFVDFDAAFDGPGRFYLLNGWNGRVSHPGAWTRLMGRRDLDAWIVDVQRSESVREIERRCGPDRALLIRTGGDTHLAIAVARCVLLDWPGAVDDAFVRHFAVPATSAAWRRLLQEDRWEAGAVARRIAAEPELAPRIEAGIRAIAARLADASRVPVNIPSVGLSQTRGAVGHCLWGNTLALVGKYGLHPDGTLAGGTLRIPGQINAESEVQALSRAFFFGRIPVTDAGAIETARRMGLPDDSYELVVRDDPRPVLDYSLTEHEFNRELVVCFGTQFEANMMDRERWVAKLRRPGVTIVVVDPVPDPWSLRHAHLVIPAPPHSAAAKLYQNGEWRLTLSSPTRQAPPQTRSDPTLIYDTMAEISRRIREDSLLRMVHPDLGFHSQSGYLRQRYEPPERGGGLPRFGGEVSRPHLWQRVLDYMDGGPGRPGPLYCRPQHADGRPIAWSELVEAGDLIYGGVGSTRYRLIPGDNPFRDIHGRPRGFTFFQPTEADLSLPEGILLNSGRSALVDEPRRVRFALDSFNSGKATPGTYLPDENPLYLSLSLAAELGIADGDVLRVRNRETGRSATWRAAPSDRVLGRTVYTPFHKDRRQLDEGRYLNAVTSQTGRCPYTAQGSFKATTVELERVAVEADPGTLPA